MIITFWSPKGGSGTTTLASSWALRMSAHTDVHLVDVGGDIHKLFGIKSAADVGFRDWLTAPTELDSDSLDRLVRPVNDYISLIDSGEWIEGPMSHLQTRIEQFQRFADHRTCVVDAGTVGSDQRSFQVVKTLCEISDISICVLRPCFLGVDRARSLKFQTSGVMLVDEPGRTIDIPDIERSLAVDVLCSVPWDAAVARAVDSGTMLSVNIRTMFKKLDKAA